MNKEEKENIEKAPLDASLKVNSKEARKLLKENGGKVQNGDVEAFVRLKDINKIFKNIKNKYNHALFINVVKACSIHCIAGFFKSVKLEVLSSYSNIFT